MTAKYCLWVYNSEIWFWGSPNLSAPLVFCITRISKVGQKREELLLSPADKLFFIHPCISKDANCNFSNPGPCPPRMMLSIASRFPARAFLRCGSTTCWTKSIELIFMSRLQSWIEIYNIKSIGIIKNFQGFSADCSRQFFIWQNLMVNNQC